jgi:hypothetical protein
MLKTIQGLASVWLLARPSNHQINRASLTLGTALALLLIAGILLTSYLQWNLSELIQKNQIHRAESYLLESKVALDMAIEFGNAHRSTLALLLAREPDEAADALQRRQTALNAYNKNLTEIDTTNSPKVAETKNTNTELSKNYETASAHLIELVQSGQLQKALDFRLSTVRPIYENWQSAHEKLSAALLEQANSQDAQNAAAIRTLRTIFLALLSIPILLILIAVLSLASLLGWEKLSTRSQSSPDPWSH